MKRLEAEPKELEEIVKEYSGNPMIRKKDMPYACNDLTGIFNAGATKFKDKYLLLFRVEDRKGISHFGKAISDDGFHFMISDRYALSPAENEPLDNKGIEDPRITKIDNKYYVAYTAYSKYGPSVGLAETKNFKRFKRLGIILPPENKDATLLPEEIKDEKIRREKGKYLLYHRPTQSRDIFVAYSNDLKHWGYNHPAMGRRKSGATWDEDKIGAGATPIKTEKGWLHIYHGVKGGTYRLGCALFDLENPAKLIGRSKIYILGPKHDSKIVFTCGATPENDGTLKIYYSIDDDTINVGTAKINDLLEICR